MFICIEKMKIKSKKKKVTVISGGVASEPTNAAVSNTSAAQAGAMRGVDNDNGLSQQLIGPASAYAPHFHTNTNHTHQSHEQQLLQRTRKGSDQLPSPAAEHACSNTNRRPPHGMRVASRRSHTTGGSSRLEHEASDELQPGFWGRLLRYCCGGLGFRFGCGSDVDRCDTEHHITSLLPLRDDTPGNSGGRYRLYFVDQCRKTVNWIGFEIADTTRESVASVLFDDFGSLAIRKYKRHSKRSPVAVAALRSPQPPDRGGNDFMAHTGLSHWRLAELHDGRVEVRKWHVLAVLVFVSDTREERPAGEGASGEQRKSPTDSYADEESALMQVHVEIIKGHEHDRRYVRHDSIKLQPFVPPSANARLGGRLVQLRPIPKDAAADDSLRHPEQQLAARGLLGAVPGSELLVAPLDSQVVYVLGLADAARCRYELVRVVLLPALLWDLNYDIVCTVMLS